MPPTDLLPPDITLSTNEARGLTQHISSISHDNWKIAKTLVETWDKIEYTQWEAEEVVETHKWNPNRRPPSSPPGNARHPSRKLAEQQLKSSSSGYSWGYFVFGQIRIAIDADSREAALSAHQALQLLTQDPQICEHILVYRIHKIRMRSDLPQLGMYEGHGVFSLHTQQSIPQMARVAAHQIGHAVHGTSDVEADEYAEAYIMRSQPQFAAWRTQGGNSASTPIQLVEQALDMIKFHAPQSYQRLKGNRIRPTESIQDATPQQIATHLLFIDLQQKTEQQLRSKGRWVEMPKDMPDCISHHSISVRPPTPPGQSQTYRVPQTGFTSTPAPSADHDWVRDESLPAQSSFYPARHCLYQPFNTMAEGGRCVYRNITIVGTKKNCENIKAGLDECWADPEARELIWGKKLLTLIYASRIANGLSGFWGLSRSARDAVIHPGRDAISTGGTIYHETFHNAGLGEDQHPFIYRKQSEFRKRRRYGRVSLPVAA